jgi:hypothetical protein
MAARRGAHYLITVKRNQPGLPAQLAALPWRQVRVAHQTREKGHGRAERRTLKVTAVAAGLAIPHAAQAIQIVRRRRTLTGKNTKKWSTQTVYAVTSLTAHHVFAEATLQAPPGILDPAGTDTMTLPKEPQVAPPPWRTCSKPR